MDKLPESFNKYGTFYRQVRRSGQFAIFELRYTVDSPIIGYDVVTVGQVEKGRFDGTVFTKTGDTKEIYPSSEKWGKKAWSFDKLETAQAKFAELLK